MKPVNLLPQADRRRAPSERDGKAAYGAIGLLAVLLVMVAVYVLTANQVTDRENRAAVARAEADRLEAEAARKSSFSDFSQIAETRFQSVVGVAQTRFDWERTMRELSRIMPDGSWLQSADASVLGDDPASSSTNASSGAAVAAPQPAMTVVGCTREQTEVAQLMVRMRAMHRVSDVELNQSTQEDLKGKATVDSCGDFYKFDVTVSFASTQPAREAPRGETRVPVSLGGGS